MFVTSDGHAYTRFKRASRAKAMQRSIHLTPFGRDFCEVCPLDTAEMEAQSQE
jgi:hypothetical protein